MWPMRQMLLVFFANTHYQIADFYQIMQIQHNNVTFLCLAAQVEGSFLIDTQWAREQKISRDFLPSNADWTDNNGTPCGDKGMKRGQFIINASCFEKYGKNVIATGKGGGERKSR